MLMDFLLLGLTILYAQTHVEDPKQPLDLIETRKIIKLAEDQMATHRIANPPPKPPPDAAKVPPPEYIEHRASPLIDRIVTLDPLTVIYDGVRQ